jgi:hypothetical protein
MAKFCVDLQFWQQCFMGFFSLFLCLFAQHTYEAGIMLIKISERARERVSDIQQPKRVNEIGKVYFFITFFLFFFRSANKGKMVFQTTRRTTDVQQTKGAVFFLEERKFIKPTASIIKKKIPKRDHQKFDFPFNFE